MRGIIILSSTSSVVFHTAPLSRDVVDHIVALVESDVHVRAMASSAQGSSPSSSPLVTSQGGGGVFRRGRTQGAYQQAAALRRASSTHRHGDRDLEHGAQFLSTNQRRVCEGLFPLYPEDHAFLHALTRSATSATAAGATSGLADAVPHDSSSSDDNATPSVELAWQKSKEVSFCVLWRKVSDRVLIFLLDGHDCLSMARNAMSNLVVLLAEAFQAVVGSSGSSGDHDAPTLKSMLTRPDIVQVCCSCVAPQHLLATVPLHIARSMMHRLLQGKDGKR